MKKLLSLVWTLLLLAPSLFAQQTVFQSVKIRRRHSADKRVLVDKIGTLTFDDTAHKLIFKGEGHENLEIGYEDVEKAVSEVTTHMRAGGVSRAISFVEFPFGVMVASAIAGVHVNSHWLYLKYRTGDRESSVLIETPEDASVQIESKAAAVLGSRLTVTTFAEKPLTSSYLTLRA
jgi:hypothetical protein